MPTTFPGYSKYGATFRQLQTSCSTQDTPWLYELRNKGFNAFNKLKFPTATSGNERWKHTNVGQIAKTSFEYTPEADDDLVSQTSLHNKVPWDNAWTRLVFVNGVFSTKLSSNRDECIRSYVDRIASKSDTNNTLLNKHLARYAKIDEDGFTAINTAFTYDGAVVNIPDGISLDNPIHILFVATTSHNTRVSYPRTLILTGKHSKLTVLESYVSLSDNIYFTNAVTEIVAGEGSEIEHYRYLMESPHAFHIGTSRVSMHKNSRIFSTSLARGSQLSRNDLGIELNGVASSCTVNGLYFTSGSQHVDNHIDIDHATTHTSSNQNFKGVLSGKSRAVFSGRVLVREGAQKSYARQSDKNLLLSDGARINTKPSLEIFADDVECYHGATAGALAEDAIFYMCSRGLDKETARQLLVSGFANEIIDGIGLESLRNHMHQTIAKGIGSDQPNEKQKGNY